MEGALQISKKDIVPRPKKQPAHETVWRWDMRSPQEIMRTGFEGSIGNDEIQYWNPIYGKDTVFSSGSKMGNKFYMNEELRRSYAHRPVEQGGLGQKIMYHQYEINTRGMDKTDIRKMGQEILKTNWREGKEGSGEPHKDDYARVPKEAVTKMANLSYKGEGWNVMPTVRNYLAGPVNFSHEVMLKGPVQPHRITHVASKVIDNTGLEIHPLSTFLDKTPKQKRNILEREAALRRVKEGIKAARTHEDSLSSRGTTPASSPALSRREYSPAYSNPQDPTPYSHAQPTYVNVQQPAATDYSVPYAKAATDYSVPYAQAASDATPYSTPIQTPEMPRKN